MIYVHVNKCMYGMYVSEEEKEVENQCHYMKIKKYRRDINPQEYLITPVYNIIDTRVFFNLFITFLLLLLQILVLDMSSSSSLAQRMCYANNDPHMRTFDGW